MKNDIDFGTYIEMRDRHYILCDGGAVLITYTDSLIVISSKSGRLSITGDGLTLDYMAGERIAIKGNIAGVKYD